VLSVYTHTNLALSICLYIRTTYTHYVYTLCTHTNFAISTYTHTHLPVSVCMCVCVCVCARASLCLLCVCIVSGCPYTCMQSIRYLYAMPQNGCHYICTGWRRPMKSLQLQVIVRKRATNYRKLSRKMTYKDKASYGSSPTCIKCLKNTRAGFEQDSSVYTPILCVYTLILCVYTLIL